MLNVEVKMQKAYMAVILIQEYCENEPDGGTCAPLLEGGKHGSVIPCLKTCIEVNDFWGETICRLLLAFTEPEVKMIIEKPEIVRRQFANNMRFTLMND